MTKTYTYLSLLLIGLNCLSVTSNAVSKVNIDSYTNTSTVPLDVFNGSSAPIAVIMMSDLEHDYDGEPKEITVTTYPEGIKTKILYNGSKVAPSKPGIYLVEATVEDSNYEKSPVVDILVIKGKSKKKNSVDSNVIYLFNTDKDLLIIKSKYNCSIKVFDNHNFPVYETNGFNLMNIATEKFGSGKYKLEIISGGETVIHNFSIE